MCTYFNSVAVSIKYSKTEAHGLPNCNPRDNLVENKCGVHVDLDLNLDDVCGHREEKKVDAVKRQNIPLQFQKKKKMSEITFSIILINDFHL